VGLVASLEIVVLGAGTFDVKGASETDEAPGKATEVVLGFGASDVALGLRTPSITCTTPLLTKTLGVTTFAELTKTLPSSIVIVTLAPLTVGSVALLSIVL